ncbi:response regulator transcription factor [Microlunatus antarcticus]|uniref:Two-component system OmpR family response regulator n=1 Tax=Microlunatus antarcticus TaxID=53388 RepID=A0A7W5P728_9ACTN|nr:two-component system OmpR family response regulator [Microlunatus antarcticus]
MQVPSAAAGAKILVVDDAESITEMLRLSLRFVGFEVATAGSGSEARSVASRFQPDLVILDVMLPDTDGFTLLRELRRDRDLPVLFLTARDAVEDRVRGLTLGADDYVTKPFSLEEVVARVGTILRRSRSTGELDPGETRLTYADLVMDEEGHQVWRHDELVNLSPTEFALLRYLLHNSGRVLSRSQILQHVWHYDFNGDGSVVDSYIRYLRRKIDVFDPPLVQTVRGVGYTLRLVRSTP